MAIDLTGKAAVVTGGSRGIGREIGLSLAKYGADVLLSYRKEAGRAEEVASAIRAIGRRAIAFQADVADAERLTAMAARAAEEFGKIDVLVANAGADARMMTVVDTPVEDWEHAISTNLLGVVKTLRAVLPVMRNTGGSVVLISSADSYVERPLHAPYAVTKAAVNTLGRIVAKEEARHGIRVNVVAPGMIRVGKSERILAKWDEATTERFMRGILLRRVGEGAEIAEAVAFLASDAASYTTGALLKVDGGF